MEAAQQTIYLKDYSVPAYLVDEVHLTFRLDPQSTTVVSRISFRPNPESADKTFFLHGSDLKLNWAKVDGTSITPDTTKDGLTCDVPDVPFVWEAEVEIDPASNTALEGLYMSNGLFSTQCEAEGFRKITFYPDRPDVMATFTVRIEGDQPVLLSNGNLIDKGEGWAEWHDPWPKPAYLFALVAGDLVALNDGFTTRSGADVELNIYVRPGDEDKCRYAMDALKRSMAWDEAVYGREYDLDIFNIVAVDDFNAGAMENKGLNIFNAAYVLASPETATDGNYETIEAVIAHEYFHNWTGNRITCRDWFQLCLKEGLTVFRDQQFTGDMRSRAVKRIEDAMTMQRHQYPEDNGPLAHPVRPESFVEINNFYTATVYEKGAEVISMLKTLVGDAAYGKALDLYFERHDGDAATIEDWLQVFEDTTGRELSQFKLWYSQAGTPRVSAEEAWDGSTFSLTLRQELPPTPGQDGTFPMVIPVSVGLLDADGDDVVPTKVLELTEAEQTFEFKDLAGRPVASILRNYSAPVILSHSQSEKDMAFLFANDSDPFNRWSAGEKLKRQALLDLVIEEQSPNEALTDGLRSVILDDALDPAFRALCLGLPSQKETAQALSDQGHIPDPAIIHAAHETLASTIALALDEDLSRLHSAQQILGPYSPDAKDAGKRSLANASLSYLNRIDGGLAATKQFGSADNMTNSLAALTCLVRIGKGDDALTTFADRWASERLVMDKWFALQIENAAPDDVISVAMKLLQHPEFELKNPNRYRSVVNRLAGYQAGFHVAGGAGYKLVADQIIALDALNPSVAARTVTAFQSLPLWDEQRQTLMRASLARIGQTKGLSKDTSEMVARILG